MHRNSQFNDILDMDILKHQVKITSSYTKPYELPGFLQNSFKGNKIIQNAFLRMDEDFKNQFYQTIKFFQTDSTALNNPFYIKKYKELYQKLSHKMKQNSSAGGGSGNANYQVKVQVPEIAISQADFNMFDTQVSNLNRNNQRQKVQNLNIDQLTKLVNFDSQDINNLYSKKQAAEVSNAPSHPPPIQIIEHKFQMPGAGSAAIFDVDIDSNPYDFVDDQFGQATKATIEPLFKLKNADHLGKSIMMNNVMLEKKQNIVNINDLIDFEDDKGWAERRQGRKQGDRGTEELVINLNQKMELQKKEEENQFEGFSSAETGEAKNLQKQKFNIYDLNLDDEGQQIKEEEVKQEEAREEENKSQNKVTTDKDSQSPEVIEDIIKEEKKNVRELEQDIYRSIEEMDIQVSKNEGQEGESGYQQNQQQNKQIEKENKQDQYQKNVEKKQSVDIFEMELEGIPQIEKMELLPIQIITFGSKSNAEQAKQQIELPKQQIFETTNQQKEQTKQQSVQEVVLKQQIKQEIKVKDKQETKQQIKQMQIVKVLQIKQISLPPVKQQTIVQQPQSQQSPKIIKQEFQSKSQPKSQSKQPNITWIKQQLPSSEPNPTFNLNISQLKRLKPITQVSIPKSLSVSTLQKWRQFYKKKNYQCQIQFYRELKQQLYRLQYFDKIEFVEQEMEVVQQIKRLSEEYSKCVSLDEEELVHAVVKGIQKKIMALRKQETKLIADLCMERNGKSLTAEIYQEVCSRQPELSQTFVRLARQSESPQNKLELFIQVAFISLLITTTSITELIKRYKQITQKLFKSFQAFKLHIEQLRRMSNDSTSEILKSLKFQHYVLGIKKYYQLAFKLSEIIKLIEGQNTYKSRLNKLRIEVNGIYQSLNLQHSLDISMVEESTRNKDWLREYFNPYLEFLSTGKGMDKVGIRVCGVCFEESGGMRERKGGVSHPECWNAAKSL